MSPKNWVNWALCQTRPYRCWYILATIRATRQVSGLVGNQKERTPGVEAPEGAGAGAPSRRTSAQASLVKRNPERVACPMVDDEPQPSSRHVAPAASVRHSLSPPSATSSPSGLGEPSTSRESGNSGSLRGAVPILWSHWIFFLRSTTENW